MQELRERRTWCPHGITGYGGHLNEINEMLSLLRRVKVFPRVFPVLVRTMSKVGNVNVQFIQQRIL